MKRPPLLILFLLFWASLLCGEQNGPYVYLTWKSDPTTTMTIRWVTSNKDLKDEIDYKNFEEDGWHQIVGSHRFFPNNLPSIVHEVELTNLVPGARYQFRLSNRSTSPLFTFHTVPTHLNSPLKFVVGGDLYHDAPRFLEETCKVAAGTSPQFALMGGDLAYASQKFFSQQDDATRWIDFVRILSEQMVTPKGDLIPLITAIGNHDVNGRYGQTPEQAPFYYLLFAPHEEVGYHALDMGPYLSLFILDTNHTHPIEGTQTNWLFHALNERKCVPYKMALYHVPAYPSVRKFNTKSAPEVREHWVPLFDQFGLTTAFENHDHAYKRSFLLTKGEVSTSGVLYLGDGGWGVEYPRAPKIGKAKPYLAKAVQARHFIEVMVYYDKVEYTAMDSTGKVIDRYTKNR